MDLKRTTSDMLTVGDIAQWKEDEDITVAGMTWAGGLWSVRLVHRAFTPAMRVVVAEAKELDVALWAAKLKLGRHSDALPS